ncbi:MAG: hypothetical protein RR598_08385 [Anaerorhabdus sp.]
MADLITKFYYLEHGKPAPSNSHYSGIVTTESIVGFKYYTSREEAKELSTSALKINENLGKSFYDYTSQRIGATKTYSSIGWIDTPTKDAELKNLISESFHNEGDLIWTPIISLEDYMTSTEMKLFNEEDYAAVIQKVLPDWFKKTGFDYDNITFWMDHHVNTEHPHLHLNFLEKEKVHTDGKLKMKDINNFKSSLWKEIFSKKRYLESTGKSVEEGFKNKDILKKEIVSKFKDSMKLSTNKEFNKQLKDLYTHLPSGGRLQYNSSHMIDYRDELNKVVNTLLATPGVNNKYQEFQKCLKEFDDIRSKSLHSNYATLAKSEDEKLHVLLANTILHEFKNIDFNENAKLTSDDNENIFVEPDIEKTQKKEIDKYKNFMIAKSLIEKETDDYYFVRIPKSDSYVYVDKDNCELPSASSKIIKAYISSSDIMEIFDKSRQGIDEVHYFDGGKEKQTAITYENIGDVFTTVKQKNLSSMKMNGLDNHQTKYKEETITADDFEKRINEQHNQTRKEDWVSKNKNWNQMGKRIRGSSFSFMNEIERDVEKARNEYLHNNEEGYNV